MKFSLNFFLSKTIETGKSTGKRFGRRREEIHQKTIDFHRLFAFFPAFVMTQKDANKSGKITVIRKGNQKNYRGK